MILLVGTLMLLSVLLLYFEMKQIKSNQRSTLEIIEDISEKIIEKDPLIPSRRNRYFETPMNGQPNE